MERGKIMSHLVEIEVSFTNMKILKKAITKLGFSVEENKVVRIGTAEIKADLVVRIPGFYGPAAFIKQGKKIDAKCDYFDVSKPGWNLIKQRYGVETAVEQARKLGHTVSQTVQPDGSVVLNIMQM